MNKVYTDLERKTKSDLGFILYNVWRNSENESDAFDNIASYVLEYFTPKKVSKIDWIDEWLELFPSGVKSGGKLIRSDKAACLKKMEAFVKINKYSKDLIMSATKDYLDDKERDNYMYTKCATYLIDKKGEGSELAALCEQYKPRKKEAIPYFNNNGLI